jgi:hypothetical protein
MASSGVCLVLRDADGRILAIVLLLEINEISARVDDRDAERIPISLGRLGDGGGRRSFLAVSRLIGSP